MKPSSPRPAIFRPLLAAGLLMLALLCLCPGCDKKQGAVVGEKPPAPPGSDLRGEPIDLGSLKGKVVVLYFWADTCCADKVKLLEPFYRRFRDRGLAILAVNVGSPAKLVESYGTKNGLTFTLLTDEHSATAEQYGVFGFPTVFILDHNGVIRQKVLGEISVEQLQKLVERQFAVQEEVETQFGKSHPR